MTDKILKVILVTLSIAAFTFVFLRISGDQWTALYDKYFPCTVPIQYSLGTFDPRFGISQADFLQALQDAENIWEKPLGKNLFTYVPGSNNLKVNLIYDYRQDATTKISDLGVAVDNTRASYDALKSKYNSLQASYVAEKDAYTANVENFKAKQDSYNAEVAMWNKKGGAPPSEYKKLQTEADDLQTELNSIKGLESDINNKASEINSLIVEINKIAQALNIKVDSLNTIGQSAGEEFTEGEYKSDASGQEIDIYQFSTKEKLKRVLAHELGHALGLDHVADPNAIMYKLNQGTGDALTADDLAAVKAYCHIK